MGAPPVPDDNSWKYECRNQTWGSRRGTSESQERGKRERRTRCMWSCTRQTYWLGQQLLPAGRSLYLLFEWQIQPRKWNTNNFWSIRCSTLLEAGNSQQKTRDTDSSGVYLGQKILEQALAEGRRVVVTWGTHCSATFTDKSYMNYMNSDQEEADTQSWYCLLLMQQSVVLQALTSAHQTQTC